MLPLFYLVISSTKTNPTCSSTFGLWFGHAVSPVGRTSTTVFTFEDGVFGRWLLNTASMPISAVGASLLCSAAGYAFAKFRFRGRGGPVRRRCSAR